MIFDDKFISELRTIVADHDTVSREKTFALTKSIVIYLESRGLIVSEEISINLYRSGIRKTGKKYQYQGRIDIFAQNKDTKIAIEIDRSNKAWSLKKLEYCAKEMGCLAVWVRWKGKVYTSKNSEVFVLNLDPVS